MKEKQQLVALCELCGWHEEFDEQQNSQGYWTDNQEGPYSGWLGHDPVNDLNALHEAEKVLTLPQWRRYVNILGACDSNAQLGNWQFVCHATAAQRTEAILRATGKWKDS